MSPSDPRIYLTLRCNLSCSYCSNGPSPAHYEELSSDEWGEWFARNLRTPGVVFTGGEPTLHRGIADIVAMAVARCRRVEVYSNFFASRNWASVPAYPRLHWRASCHAQTAEAAREWVANVEAARAAGHRVFTTTVLAPAEVAEVLRPHGVCVDAPQVKPAPMVPPVICALPRVLVAPDGNRYYCVGKLVRHDTDGIVDVNMAGSIVCYTPDQCAVCDSLSAQRRVLE